MKIVSIGICVGLMSVGACNPFGGGDKTQSADSASATPPTPETSQPASGDIIRYGTMEATDSGTMTIRQSVRARKAADTVSAMIEILQAGTSVNKIARYGNYALVSWTSSDGASKQGWIDSALALRSPDVPDAGPSDNKGNYKDFGGDSSKKKDDADKKDSKKDDKKKK